MGQLSEGRDRMYSPMRFCKDRVYSSTRSDVLVKDRANSLTIGCTLIINIGYMFYNEHSAIHIFSIHDECDDESSGNTGNSLYTL